MNRYYGIAWTKPVSTNTVGRRCEICNVITKTSRHHIFPTSVAKYDFKPTEVIKICLKCHTLIHKKFSNEELAYKYNTIEKLSNAIFRG